jgi:heptaprenyl diphosphate synthase
MEKAITSEKRTTGQTSRITLLGLLFALAMVLSVLEGLFPVPVPIPGVRLGLANIVVMFALLYLKKADALTLVVLKSIFVASTRGLVAGMLSLTGGLFALGIMVLILLLRKDKSTLLLISVAGAVFHNLGQITAASFIMETVLWVYLPVLLLSGIVTGFATSMMLKMTSPVFLKLHLNKF